MQQPILTTASPAAIPAPDIVWERLYDDDDVPPVYVATDGDQWWWAPDAEPGEGLSNADHAYCADTLRELERIVGYGGYPPESEHDRAAWCDEHLVEADTQPRLWAALENAWQEEEVA